MDVKKVIQIFIIVIGMIFFASRTQLIGELVSQVIIFFEKASGANYTLVENRLNNIIRAINEDDDEKIKAMFSTKVLEGNYTLDDDAYILTEFFTSEIYAHKGALKEVVESADKNEQWFTARYEVETYYGKYNIYFIDQIESASPDNIGLHYLQISHIDDKETVFPNSVSFTGIVVRPWEGTH